MRVIVLNVLIYTILCMEIKFVRINIQAVCVYIGPHAGRNSEEETT